MARLEFDRNAASQSKEITISWRPFGKKRSRGRTARRCYLSCVRENNPKRTTRAPFMKNCFRKKRTGAAHESVQTLIRFLTWGDFANWPFTVDLLIALLCMICVRLMVFSGEQQKTCCTDKHQCSPCAYSALVAGLGAVRRRHLPRRGRVNRRRPRGWSRGRRERRDRT